MKTTFCWHTSNEEPRDHAQCLIHYGGNCHLDFDLAIYSAVSGRFVSRSYPHPTGRYFEAGRLVEAEPIAATFNVPLITEYQAWRDKVPLNEVKAWAYIDELMPSEH